MKHTDFKTQVRKDIDSFRNYVIGEINNINNINVDPNRNYTYKKLFFSCLLDSIGQIRYPKGKNEDRIKVFIDKYADWTNKNKVSIPQLYYNLKVVLCYAEKRKSLFYKEIEEQVRNVDKGAVRNIDADPKLDDLIKRTQNRIEKKCVKMAEYSNLFHSYRHWLVHSFIDPGSPQEFPEKRDAYYFPKANPNEPQRLGFPVKLFEKVVRSCLDGLLEYCEKKNIRLYGDKGRVEKEIFHDIWSFVQLKRLRKNEIKRRLRIRSLERNIKKIINIFKL